MDHSHCFTCGKPLSPKIRNINHVKDEGVYGLFPEFQPWLDDRIVGQAVEKLRSFTNQDAQAMTQDIPTEWEMNVAIREALGQFLVARAAFLASSIMDRLFPGIEPVSLMDEAESNP
jgi:hypothetical protein